MTQICCGQLVYKSRIVIPPIFNDSKSRRTPLKVLLPDKYPISIVSILKVDGSGQKNTTFYGQDPKSAIGGQKNTTFYGQTDINNAATTGFAVQTKQYRPNINDYGKR